MVPLRTDKEDREWEERVCVPLVPVSIFVNTGSIPGSGRCPGGGHGNPLQDSCLETPMDRGVWRATVCGVVGGNRQSWTPS